MNNVRKLSNSECYEPSSEPCTIYLLSLAMYCTAETLYAFLLGKIFPCSGYLNVSNLQFRWRGNVTVKAVTDI
jgi:hypothetical protein